MCQRQRFVLIATRVASSNVPQGKLVVANNGGLVPSNAVILKTGVKLLRIQTPTNRIWRTDV